MNGKKTLLVLRLSALGDVAMTVPAIYSFARRHPDWQVKVLTQTFFGQLFVRKPDNVMLLTVDREECHGIGNVVRLLDRLLAERPTHVADLHNVPLTWLVDAVMLLAGRRVAMVDKKRLARRLVRQGMVSGLRFTQRYFEVFDRLGLPTEPAFGTLFDGEPQERHVGAWVGVAPFARYRNKTYPLPLMEKVVALLAGTGNMRVWLFGGRGHESDMLQRWAARLPGVHCVAGHYDLEEELRLMAQLDVMVSMDSANMHLASLVGVRVVSVWGSTAPVCGFLGWGQHHEDCLVAGTDCQPCTTCGSWRCRRGDLRCLYAFRPQQIVDKVMKVLNDKGLIV